MKAETAHQHNAKHVGFYELRRDEPGADMIKAMFEACGHNIKFIDCPPKEKDQAWPQKNKSESPLTRSRAA